MTQPANQPAGTTISYKRPDGKDVSGYLASPAKTEGAPAIVVIQEWWGLNDQIRGVADRLASPTAWRRRVTWRWCLTCIEAK